MCTFVCSHVWMGGSIKNYIAVLIHTLSNCNALYNQVWSMYFLCTKAMEDRPVIDQKKMVWMNDVFRVFFGFEVLTEACNLLYN